MYQLLCHCLCLAHSSIFIVIFLVCVYVVYVVYCLKFYVANYFSDYSRFDLVTGGQH